MLKKFTLSLLTTLLLTLSFANWAIAGAWDGLIVALFISVLWPVILLGAFILLIITGYIIHKKSDKIPGLYLILFDIFFVFFGSALLAVYPSLGQGFLDPLLRGYYWFYPSRIIILVLLVVMTIIAMNITDLKVTREKPLYYVIACLALITLFLSAVNPVISGSLARSFVNKDLLFTKYGNPYISQYAEKKITWGRFYGFDKEAALDEEQKKRYSDSLEQENQEKIEKIKKNIEGYLLGAETLIQAIDTHTTSSELKPAINEIGAHLKRFIELSCRYYGGDCQKDTYDLENLIKKQNVDGLKQIIYLKKEWWVSNRNKLTKIY